jgi:hypothetical protein
VQLVAPAGNQSASNRPASNRPSSNRGERRATAVAGR